MIETVRVSEKAKIQLITLKRRTNIQNWNVLCRWAFCISLSEKSEPPDEDIPADSSIEMTWKTFAGGYEEVYHALLKIRANKAGVPLERDALIRYFRLHLHRGISYLSGNPKLLKIEDLIRLAA
jgi:DNA sulfur modification protein DndE